MRQAVGPVALNGVALGQAGVGPLDFGDMTG